MPLVASGWKRDVSNLAFTLNLRPLFPLVHIHPSLIDSHSFTRQSVVERAVASTLIEAPPVRSRIARRPRVYK